ncbi:MAG TPA: RDD family protein [Longimicrobium sp.]|nr:RDD family protein [Longimicrobium sp.]
MAQAVPPAQLRSNITPESFAVAPHLLGLPLARPSRRLMAILIDLALVAALVNLGGFVFGLAAALAFFRFASKALGRGDRLISRAARVTFRVLGAVILFVLALDAWDRFTGDDDPSDTREERAEGAPEPPPAPGGGTEVRGEGLAGVVGAVGMVREIAALQGAPDSAAAHAATLRLVERMRAMGSTDAQIRETAESLAEDEEEEEDEKTWLKGAVAAALAGLPQAAEAPPAVAPDSLARLYASAAGRDSVAADTLGRRLGSALARDSLDGLREEVRSLTSATEGLQEALEAEKDRGLLQSVLAFLNDLGLGFGWTGLYFTAFTALWKGQTPGKRLLGIRVVRLNGQPVTLWAAFERFGGYAAGLFTGLLGFAQVYWDRNRQAIHDKITETVVVREKGVPAPLPPRPEPQAAASPLGARPIPTLSPRPAAPVPPTAGGGAGEG